MAAASSSDTLNMPGAWDSWPWLRRLAKLCPGEDAACSVEREPMLTRSELIAELLASNPHLLKADVELIVATVFDRITDALARGDRVELRGFGAFTVKRRNARLGRNPRTGEPVSVDEKARPFFKTGRDLRERLNRGEPSRAAPIAPASAASPR